MKRIDRLGEENYNSQNSLMKIIEYKDNMHIVVEFQDEYKMQVGTTYARFKNGTVKNPHCTFVHGVGFIGDGKSRIENKRKPAYEYWSHMLGRCYSQKVLEERPSYQECSVCNEWLNFETFEKWYDENFYQIDGEKMALDKDILIKGNKEYGPNACVFVPQRINSLFVISGRSQSDLPIGVTERRYKNSTSYISRCYIDGNRYYIGQYKTPEEAFAAYKTFKDQRIKQVANEYKYQIPQKLYDAMYQWEVEITD